MGRLRDLLGKLGDVPGLHGRFDEASQAEHTREVANDGPVTPRDVFRFRRQRGVNLGE